MEEFIGPTSDTRHISVFNFLLGRIFCIKCKTKMKFIIVPGQEYFKCNKCGHLSFYKIGKKGDEDG